jgi:carbon monoxide dehydrogenase subunit G
MKLSGTHKFKAADTQVFNAILNPEVLKACIPGCNSIEYLDTNRIEASLTLPLPGMKGAYTVVINIANQQAPRYLELQVQRSGRGGSVNAVSQINFTNEADGTTLSYNANAELSGAAAFANNPLGEGAAKNLLGTFFKNLDKTIS